MKRILIATNREQAHDYFVNSIKAMPITFDAET